MTDIVDTGLLGRDQNTISIIDLSSFCFDRSFSLLYFFGFFGIMICLYHHQIHQSSLSKNEHKITMTNTKKILCFCAVLQFLIKLPVLLSQMFLLLYCMKKACTLLLPSYRLHL